MAAQKPGTAPESNALYARGVPVELRRFIEEEALRRKYDGKPATIGELVSEALALWRDNLLANGHHTQQQTVKGE